MTFCYKLDAYQPPQLVKIAYIMSKPCNQFREILTSVWGSPGVTWRLEFVGRRLGAAEPGTGKWQHWEVKKYLYNAHIRGFITAFWFTPTSGDSDWYVSGYRPNKNAECGRSENIGLTFLEMCFVYPIFSNLGEGREVGKRPYAIPFIVLKGTFLGFTSL